MPVCTLHPEVMASGACEFCTQPHCADCLRPCLGRQYCPSCLAKVEAIAGAARPGNRRQPDPGPVTATHPAAHLAAHSTAPAEPRLRGWASALLYLVGFFIVVKIGAESVAILPLLFAKGFSGHLSGAADPMTDLLDPAGIGFPIWSLLLGMMTWGSLVATLLFTFLMARGVERRPLPWVGLTWPPRWRRDCLAGLGLAAILFISLVGIGVARGWYVIRGTAPFVPATLTTLVGFALLLPYAAVEEISLRGYFFQASRRSWGTAGAVAASSLAFAALHSMNPSFKEYPLAILGLLLAGLYLATARLITGNLWLAIFLHTGWNLMEGPVFGLPVSGLAVPASVFRTSVEGPELWTGGLFGPEASLLLCILIAVHIAALWSVHLLFRVRDGDEAPSDGASGGEVDDPSGTGLYTARQVSDN